MAPKAENGQQGKRGPALTTASLMPIRLRRAPDEPLIAPEHPFAEHARAIMNAAFVLGRSLPEHRFRDEDVEGNVWLRRAAEIFCVLYHARSGGDRVFISEVRNDAHHLSVAQARGVLNCLMHDGEERIARRAATLEEGVGNRD